LKCRDFKTCAICVTATFVFGLLPATPQETNPAPPATAPPTAPKPSSQAPPPVPLIKLDDGPRNLPQDQMKLINPNRDHPAPAEPPPGSPLPQMDWDANGGLTVARAKESFSNLTLEGSDLVAQEPLFGGREETPTYIRELWQLKWRPNDPIDFYIILPRNVKKPPVILYLYGFPSDTDRFKDDGYCTRVVRNGAAAIGFVSALTGQRYNFRPFSHWFVSELPESLAATVHDVQMILNQLKTRQDLDLTRIGMFGQGSGGAIAILAAAADTRIQVLDLLDPWGDWPDWFAKSDAFPEDQRATYLKPDFQQKLEPLEPAHYLPQLKDRKIRIQFVKQYGEPENAVKRLEAAAPATAQVNHFETGHDLFEAYSGGRLFTWIDTELHAHPGDPVQASTQPAKATVSPKEHK
jgi:hypothetical protein